MPFDNFCEESDKAARRWWKFIGLAALILFAYFATPMVLFGLFDNDEKQFDEEAFRVKQNNADSICRDLPTPVEFVFVGKEFSPPNLSHPSVEYRFRSNRTFADIENFYEKSLDKRGWRRDRYQKHTFRKNLQTVSISTAESFDADFVLICSEETISFGIYD